MENTNEIWQAEVNGQIYEASFEELAQWITEGALLPQDKVRRGNLRWIEANKVPTLYGYFNAMTLGVNQPNVQTTDAASSQADFAKLEGINCVLHNEVEAKFYCETCINYFCYDCPKTAGGLANCCPLCGAICNPLQQPEEKSVVAENNVADEQSLPPEIAHAAHQTIRTQNNAGVGTIVEPPKKASADLFSVFLWLFCWRWEVRIYGLFNTQLLMKQPKRKLPKSWFWKKNTIPINRGCVCSLVIKQSIRRAKLWSKPKPD